MKKMGDDGERVAQAEETTEEQIPAESIHASGQRPGSSPEQYSEEQEVQRRAQGIREEIDKYYETVPTKLQTTPEVQQKCLDRLLNAERRLSQRPLSRIDLILAKREVTEVAIEMERAKGRRRSTGIVGVVIYLFAGVAILGFQAGIFSTQVSAEEFNQQLVAAIPFPVWIWAIIGSFTSMLLRAGQFPFSDINEAIRWLLFRPIVGLVMGLLTYLMLIAGLIVFAGDTSTQAPELIWVIAFIGGFSDTLSINLLQRLLGRFRPVETEEREGQYERKADENGDNGQGIL